MFDQSVYLLMLPAFCECLVLIGIHAYLGLHVIKREIIFVDLALAQIAALGVLIAFLFGIPPHTPASYVFSLSITALGAAVFTLCRFRESKVPQEAVIGLVYAIAAAVAILMIDKAPHGAEHLKDILTGSILWVKWRTIAITAVVYAVIGLFHYIYRKKFLLVSENPEKAREMGMNILLWDFLFFFTFGIVITLAVEVAGVLIVFVFLVAPAVLAILITDRLMNQLLIGWGLGVVVTTVGLFASYLFDLPTGPAVIGAYAAVLLIVAAILYNLRAPDRLRSLKTTALIILLFAVAFGLLILAGRLIAGARAGEHEMHGYGPAGGTQRTSQAWSRFPEDHKLLPTASAIGLSSSASWANFCGSRDCLPSERASSG